MTDAVANPLPSPGGQFRAWADSIRGLMATSSLARSVVALLVGALVLLMLVNASTFVMIRRTADFNDQVDATWQVRRAARGVLLNVQEAETAQRGFLLTGQTQFFTTFEEARAANPDLLQDLQQRVADDAASQASAEALSRIAGDKFIEMSTTLDLARQGRIGEAVSTVRTGQGQVLMDQFRAELNRVDTQQGARVAAFADQSRRSAAVTVAVNAVAGLLILVLAGIIFMLVRRYLAEINEARATVDRINAGLEDTVRGRTAALTRANEEVQRFAYIVSHDLRSPLVNVMGYTSELEQAGKTIERAIAEAETHRAVDPEVVSAVREDMPEAIGFIRASTEKMDRLINAILKLSREGRRNLTPETLDMTAMVGRIADSVRHQTEAANAEVVVEPLPEFESDRLSIEQIMGNLIDNAVKYLEPTRPGRIVVSGADLAGGWVEYAIADNGRGISSRDHERIFELFRRSGRQDRPGEGLGLAFVRNSVRRMGGSIEIESELGTGSTFRVKFPKRLILAEAGDI